MLVIVFMVMMYGPGMPIMYPIAFAKFLVTYWVEKFLLIYHHSKPLYFDHNFALDILSWFKFGVVFHLVLGILMYSSSHLLPVKYKFKLEKQTGTFAFLNEHYPFGSLGTNHISAFVYVFVIIGLIYFIYNSFYMIIYKCYKQFCKKKLRNFESELLTDNIYSVMSFSELAQTYQDTIERLEKLKLHLDSNFDLEFKNKYQEYLKQVEHQKEEIQIAIRNKANSDLQQKFTEDTPFETVYEAMSAN